MTDSVTLSGLHYLAGKTVSAYVAGLDCGDYAVDAYGQITIPTGADPDGYFGSDWLSLISNQGGYGDSEMAIVVTEAAGSFTAYVPVVIGLTYTSQAQLLRPQTDADVKSPLGTGLGKIKRSHRYGMLLHNSGPFDVGTDFANLLPALRKDTTGSDVVSAAVCDGVIQDFLKDAYGFDTMLAWQVNRPYPLTVCAAGPVLETSET